MKIEVVKDYYDDCITVREVGKENNILLVVHHKYSLTTTCHDLVRLLKSVAKPDVEIVETEL